MGRWAVIGILGGCGPDPVEAPRLPEHSECLAVGDQMEPDVCLAVVEVDDRMPTESWYKAGPADPPDPDPRLTDGEYAWLRSELERCTCSCCHTAAYGGPGVFQWDLDFQPMWIDSASGWSLDVLTGAVDSEDQFLPTDDPERLEALIEREKDRRDAANDLL